MDFTPNLVEIWTLYGFGTLMIAARVLVRTKQVGVRGYRPDDYLVWFTWMVYTTVTVIAHIFITKAQGKHTSLLTPEQRETMPLEERKSWEYGSQIFLVSFHSYAVIIWTLKFNMLFFYRRLVRGLWVERAIYPVMGFVGASAIAIILTLTLTCIPFRKLWQVYPDPKGLCVPQNRVTFYTVLALNLITDFCIFLIPIPVVAPMRTSIWRKIGLYILLGLGLFCMMAAILRVVLTFHVSHSQTLTDSYQLKQQGVSAMWTIREDFVAIFVGQAPMVYPIIRRKFWQGVYGTGNESSTGNNIGQKYENHQLTAWSTKKPKDRYSITQIGVTMIDQSESQEEMVKQGDASSGSKRQDANGIMVTQTYEIESSRTRSESSVENYHGRAI